MLVDTHCHLDFPVFDQDRDEVIRRAKAQGIDYMVNIGSSLEGSRRSVELAQKYAPVYATVGIHPHEADDFSREIEKEIKDLAKKEKVVAIGEIGLDYFKGYSRKENQLPLFSTLIKLAKELSLPLVIHTREAQADTLRILKGALPVKGVVHCFSGDKGFLKECLDLGFLVSFTCNLTYKKADTLREIIKSVPLESLLLETDAPYLAPEGLRGKRNEPAQVRPLAELVAGLKGLKFEELARVTTENARRFFNF
ncbi:MAG: TatD family hydrolase [Candidatus Omnitrophica bacterium]|nr:TatD family hydrolase [Candidatus Omnitrophota bacterium]MDD5027474.1 TatD family hydrolase [Candidatus Omnitrophota bacterium]MDD5662402.1 TatD family hydrolase [Candidatus Omnitrophota bacterium]